MNETEEAAQLIDSALILLTTAKDKLHAARNDQRYRILNPIAELNQIYEILADPECTPDGDERQ